MGTATWRDRFRVPNCRREIFRLLSTTPRCDSTFHSLFFSMKALNTLQFKNVLSSVDWNFHLK